MNAAHARGGNTETQPFPWEEAMAFGFGILRLSSTEFWAMTLPELSAAARGALGLEPGITPFDRQSLQALMTRFPDQKQKRSKP